MPDARVLEALALLQDSVGTSASPPVADLWPSYWATEGKHNDSAADIEGRWKLYLKPYFGRTPVARVTDEAVEKYRKKRSGQLTRRGLPPTPATINREVAVLRRLLNWAVEKKRIQFNPIANVRMDKEAQPRKSKIGSEAQLAQFLGHASPLLRAIILVLYDCGLRRMECLGLLWEEIDEATQSAVIGGERMKSDEPRRIRFTGRAWEAIKLLPRVGPHVFANVRVYQNGRRSKFYGQPYSETQIYKKFRQAVAEAGLPTTGPQSILMHSLRHSFVYVNRFKRRIPEKVIMRVGGWKTRSAFDRYGDVDPDELEDFYERVEASIETEQHLAKPRTGPHRAPAEPQSGVTTTTQAHDSRKSFGGKP